MLPKYVLQNLENEQKMEGKTDLAEFIINQDDKIVDSIITTAWEMENATKEKNTPRNISFRLRKLAMKNVFATLKMNGSNAQYHLIVILGVIGQGN